MQRGCELTRMRVEHIDFNDIDMKSAVERQAETNVKIEAERRNVVQQSQTRIAKAEGDAKAMRIEAQGRTMAVNAETEAEANKIRQLAAAQAEASANPLATQIALIKALAEGQAMIFAALGNKAVVLPGDMKVSMNALPEQVADLLGGKIKGGQVVLPRSDNQADK